MKLYLADILSYTDMDMAPLAGRFALPTPIEDPAAAAAEEEEEEEEDRMGPERLWDRGWPTPTPFPFCRTTVGGRDRFWKNTQNNA